MNQIQNDSEGFNSGYLFNQRYRYVEELSPGGQSRVFIVEDTHESKTKKILKMVESKEVKDVQNEINFLKTLRNKSEYIITYFDDFPFFMVKHCIVTEYCHNKDLAFELNEYKKNNETVKPHKIDYWNTEIVEGLCFLHDNKIIHRDIKPENIFLTERGNLKIGDLGYSKKADNLVSISRTVGTINYMSPEVLRNEHYDGKTDTWAYGCVLFEMIFLEKLFKSKDPVKLHAEMIDNLKSIPNTRKMYNLIFKMSLELDQTKRARMEDIKKTIEDYLNCDVDLENQNRSLTEEAKSSLQGRIFGNFEIKKPIGQGSFASVYSCIDLTNNTTKAIKMFSVKNFDYVDDVELLRDIECEFILKYYCDYQHDLFYCVVMEYVENGDLTKLIENHKELGREINKSRIFKWAFQATQCFQVLHSNRIIHRDIKPENMLLTKDDNIKICDFAVAKCLIVEMSDWGRYTNLGTPLFMSPEIIKGEEYTFNADIWSLGCVVYELAFLKAAFSGFGLDRNVDKLDFKNSIFTHLIKKMLVVNPRERPTSGELYDYMKSVEKEFM